MIKQKAAHDCLLACLATMTKQPYSMFPQEFRDKVEEESGCDGELIKKAFRFAGILQYKEIYVNDAPRDFVFHMIWNRKCLMQVPSLNIKNGHHCIYWNGQKVFDPSNKKIYTTHLKMKPEYIWLFK